MDVDPKADSTYALMREAARRGHELFHYQPTSLSLRGTTLTAMGEDVEMLQGNPHARLGPRQRINLAEMDMILLRQDPPFDMAYITNTHMLEHVMDDVLVVNNPISVRNAPEKLLVMHYPELMPETLITADPAEIRAFRAEFGDIIIKPLFGNGGAGVFKLTKDDPNLASLLEIFAERSREPLMVQRFLPQVSDGDKRIILADGAVVGAINRVPQAGEARSNMHVGGRPEKIAMTPRDHDICAAIGPMLKERGLIFVGIDVIGDHITEINVTSPTGLQELDRFDGINSAGILLDAMEARLA